MPLPTHVHGRRRSSQPERVATPRDEMKAVAPTVRGVPALPAVDSVEAPERARRGWALPVLVGLIVGAVLVRPLVADSLDSAAIRSWSTIFVSICVQAMPFL